VTTENLLFVSADGTTLYGTDGTTVTVIANGSSSTPFQSDPLLFNPTSAAVVGTTVYFTMANAADTTSAIWAYNGTAVTQITSSADYVNTAQDSNNDANPYPLAAFGNDLVFSQANATTQNDGGSYDQATLAIYNPSTQGITQPTTASGGPFTSSIARHVPSTRRHVRRESGVASG
jgi:hypothetical protein